MGGRALAQRGQRNGGLIHHIHRPRVRRCTGQASQGQGSGAGGAVDSRLTRGCSAGVSSGLAGMGEVSPGGGPWGGGSAPTLDVVAHPRQHVLQFAGVVRSHGVWGRHGVGKKGEWVSAGRRGRSIRRAASRLTPSRARTEQPLLCAPRAALTIAAADVGAADEDLGHGLAADHIRHGSLDLGAVGCGGVARSGSGAFAPRPCRQAARRPGTDAPAVRSRRAPSWCARWHGMLGPGRTGGWRQRPWEGPGRSPIWSSSRTSAGTFRSPSRPLTREQ
jgi:hypothetical protein